MPRNPFESADEIRNPAVTIQKLMEYANGAAPDVVPPVLALSELARRKKLAESNVGQAPQVNQDSPTVKQQTEQQLGLLALKQQQANKAQQAIGLPMQQAQAPMPVQGMAAGGMPGRVDPREAVKKMLMLKMMKEKQGGLEALPTGNTMSRNSFAGGGIVAFADNENQPVNTLMPGEESGIPKDEKEARNKRLQDYIFDYLRTPVTKPAKAEDALSRRYELEKIANARLGVPEGPEGKGLEDAYKKLAERQSAYYEDALSPTSKLLEFGREFATADPTKGFGYQAAKAGAASSKYGREMQKEQMKSDMEIAVGMSKIEEARRKRAEGDVDGALKLESEGKKAVEQGMKDRATVAENTYGHDTQLKAAGMRVAADKEIEQIQRVYKDLLATPKYKMALITGKDIDGNPVSEVTLYELAKQMVRSGKKATVSTPAPTEKPAAIPSNLPPTVEKGGVTYRLQPNGKYIAE